MECNENVVFQLAGWITSMVLGLGGLIITTFGWKVRGSQALKLAKQKTLHDSIDHLVKVLNDYEDAAYSYWLEKDTKIRIDQLIAFQRRCNLAISQLSKLHSFERPDKELSKIRQAATLDAEDATRPLSGHNMLRLKKLSRSIDKILALDVLKKSWD